ncbi:MAG: DNA topoisomerase VI subunit B [Candidatus Aenigmarchaeota archaeon]|nr:DNA topoisomerase VI subunit B [Candidatus Aenigmarchaeota archaeon]
MGKTAQEMAAMQKEISISEFFEKNRHLLGFDNPTKALLMAVKEAVDNSLDACEESEILPDLAVKMKDIGEDKFLVTVQDNGPGIVREQVPRIFGKLLYGSKFHRLRQSLTHDEPVMACINGKVEILPIGELVDRYIGDAELRDVSSLNIKVPSFDWKGYKYAFRKVSHVIRHRRENEILKIKLAGNREIKVTGCHSLFSAQGAGLKEVEARNLRIGDFIAAPRAISPPEEIDEINILDYIQPGDIDANWFYVYGIEQSIFEELFKKSLTVHNKTDKSRRYYRIGGIDILDDSWKQYTSKGFMPLHLALRLVPTSMLKDCILQSYYHGKPTRIPVALKLERFFMRFLGLFVAEGHVDKRQIGLTFGKHEDSLIEETIGFARRMGLSFTVEPRERSIRVKIFGNVMSLLLEKLCGKGAHNKRIPEFIFRTSRENRQHFIDALYQGDGHKVRKRNCLMFSTVSARLCNELMYLWAMQGIAACRTRRTGKGFGRNPYTAHVVSVYGTDINSSYVFKTTNTTRMRSIYHNSAALLTEQGTDIVMLPVTAIEVLNEGYEFVYDISVPECENFIGGLGGISCHNSRGQQGIGISAVALYSQLTTGTPTKIWTRTEGDKKTTYVELNIDTMKNEPKVVKEDYLDESPLKEHGTIVSIEMSGRYRKTQGVDDYLKQTSIANPFAKITYTAPDGVKSIFPRSVNELPKAPKEMKPHPYGIEFGILQRMLVNTKSRNVSTFIANDFSSTGAQSAKEICNMAKIDAQAAPASLDRTQIEKLLKAMQEAKLQRPPLDCLSPIGGKELEKSLKKEFPGAEFIVAVQREPTVYRGNPFEIEVGIAYGGEMKADEQIQIMRFANRVPLLYQAGAGATMEAIKEIEWKRYGLQQSGSNVPVGPMVLVVHMASSWVPFVSESKEAIAPYPDIVKEMKLAIQDAGRQLSRYISGKRKEGEQKRRLQIFERYSVEVATALHILTGKEEKSILAKLKGIIENRNKLKEATEKAGDALAEEPETPKQEEGE